MEENEKMKNGEETTTGGEGKDTILIEELKLLQEYKDKYFRLLAESENARKRMQKEKQEVTKYATESIVVAFLNPIDHFEQALEFAKNSSDEVKNWAVGFEMILLQFKQVLSNQGISEYSSLGNIFDPHLHEAVEIETTDKQPPGTILQEFVRGYKMGDRMIRPAKVKVAKAP